jgi:predicted nucleotide-binding protein
MMDQRVIEHHQVIAEAFISVGTITEFAVDETIIEQGHDDLDAYFILSGAARLFINHREIGRRGPRELVGEMATLDPAAPRSATLKAGLPTVALRVKGHELARIANQHPSVWRAIGCIVAERLRERARFHRPPNKEPILLIASSLEGIEVAREVQQQCKYDNCCVRIWTAGVFGPGGVPFDDLLKQALEADFAVFVATPDDTVCIRGIDGWAPRDNIIFELGMFMDRLGRERAFLFKEHTQELRIPTDLLGITPLTYVHHPSRSLAEQVAPPCQELRKLIRGLGPL